MAASSELKSLDQVEYNFGIHKLLITALILVTFVVAFMAHFPLERQVQTLVKTQLAAMPGCRIDFDSLHFEYFFPKVVLTDVKMPGSCLGGSKAVRMRRMAIKFYGPSFSPLGVALKLEADLAGRELGIHYAQGFSSQVFNIQESALPFSMLKEIIPSLPKLEGQVDLNLKAAMEGRNLSELKLLVESKNMVVAAQNLSDIKVPRLALGNLLIKAESTGPRKIALQEFVIGKQDSAIRGKFSGTIDLAPGAIAFSPVKITGEAAFAEEFLQAFPILNLMLPQFTQKDGFYQIQLGGTLGNIRPN